jgi:stress response protein SCP2
MKGKNMSSISLNKENAGVGNGAFLWADDNNSVPLGKLRFGAKWDASTRGKGGFLGLLSKKGGLDIDLIAVLMQDTKAVKYAGLDNLNPLARNGSPIVHSGDSITGEDNKKQLKKQGLTDAEIEALDDEALDVDLAGMPLEYTSIFFTASVFKANGMADAVRDKGFQGANNVEFRMYNTSGAEPVEDALIMPDLGAAENCCLIAKVSRTSLTDPAAPWKVEVLEEMVRIERGNMNSILEHCRKRA